MTAQPSPRFSPSQRSVACAVVMAASLFGCGSSKSSGPPPGLPGQTGGTGGSTPRTGSGGSPAVSNDAAAPGNGGSVPVAGAGGSHGGGSGGAGGVAAGGSGGGQVSVDGGGGMGGAPPSGAEPPLPACLKTTPVSDTAGLASALTAAMPGECLVLADGTYSFPPISKVGTEAAPIVIRAANRGKAVVASGTIHFHNAAHVVLEGMDITSPGAASTFFNAGSNGMLIAFTDSHHCRLTRNRIHPMGAPAERDWIVLSGEKTHHNRIDHNDLGPQTALGNMLVIDGTGQEEPQIAGQVSQYNRIDHNYFHDIANTGGNNWEAMRIGRSWQAPTKGFNVVERNLLKAASGDPETISVKSSDNIIRHNTMRGTGGEITLRHGNRNQVYGNYILGEGHPGSRGIRVYGADHRIFNNYLAPTQYGIWLDDGSAAATDEPGKEHYKVWRTWVFNNTIINRDVRVGGTKAFPPQDCRIANNIITGIGKLSVEEATVVEEGNHITIRNGGTSPLTMQPDGIYRLLDDARGAMAIGKAVNAAAYPLTDDIEGQPRSSPDLGADEHSTAPVTIRGPLLPADVGPDAP